MIKLIEYQIQPEVFLNVIEVAKKLKSQIIVFYSDQNKLNIYGLDKTLSIFKTIEDHSNKLNGITFPADFAIETTQLNEIEKEIKENNSPITIHCINSIDENPNLFFLITSSFIFSKVIECGKLNIPLLKFNNLFAIICRITKELSFSKSLSYKELTNDPEFMEMQLLKTEDGLFKLHIDRHLVFVAPNMLNLIKDDEASIEILQANLGFFVAFTINKKKKKCIVKVIYRMRDVGNTNQNI
jgi:hypothetical protein